MPVLCIALAALSLLCRVGAPSLGSLSVEPVAYAVAPDLCSFDVFLTVPNNCSTYAVFGDPNDELYVPPAYQYGLPFGTSVGSPDPVFFAQAPLLVLDSFLTIGDEDARTITSVGLSWDDWTATTPLRTSNGAVFMIDPQMGPRGKIRVARLTVAATSIVQLSFQGALHALTGSVVWRLPRQRASLLCSGTGH